MKRKLLIIQLLFFMILPSISRADDVDISATVDRNVVGLEEQIVLTLSITADSRSIPDPQVPDMPTLDVFSSGSSQSFNFVNGEFFASKSYTYIIMPTRPGNFTIPPFKVRVKGHEYKSEPIEIKVQSSSTRGSQSTAPPKSSRSSKVRSESGEKVFIDAEIDKKSAYIGEQVTLTFRFYQAVRLLNEPELVRPSFTGFWIEDLPPNKKYYQTIRGVRYYVTEIRTALFPTSPGEKEIEPFRVTVVPDAFQSFMNRDPFDIFGDNFFGRGRGEPQILTTRKLKLNVRPLPLEGKPAGFTGAVGKFTMQAMPDVVETETNQPVNFTIRISGSGNIKTIDRPQIKTPAEFRTYPSNTSEQINKDNYIVSGTRTFEEVLIPKSPGTFEVSPVEFAYFDPVKENYVTLKSSSYTFKVKPSAVDVAQGSAVDRQAIGSAQKDLRYLKTDLSAGSRRFALYNSPVFWIIQTLPLAGIVVALMARKRKDRFERDIDYARRRRAKAISRKILKTAEKSLADNDKTRFYGDIRRALAGYLADKLAMAPSGLTNEVLREAMNGRVSGELLKETLDILNTCDFHQFASGTAAAGDGKKFMARVEKHILELEKALK
jgi:hypothetical protein